MAEQQALNATFFAFKKREKMVLLPATVVAVVLNIVILAVFIFLSRNALIDYFTWFSNMMKSGAMEPGATPDPSAMMPPASVMGLFPLMFLLYFVQYVVIAAWEAACLKWMIRGETGGLFGLSLGADTWRVYFTYWLWFLLLMAVYVAFLIVVVVVFGVSAVSLGAGGQSDGQASASAVGAMIFLPFLLGLALCIGLVFLAVRFAPAAATSIAEKRFAFFDAWKVSRGRFWPLLGAFAIFYLMFIVGYFIAGMILGLGMMGAMFSQMSAMRTGDAPVPPNAVMHMFLSPNFLVPMAIFYLVIFAAVFTFCIALFGVNARAAALALEEGKITQAA
ncbi:MAG: hypothetical protein QM759_03665 [Terricaulis sp.]